jgi:hypothetical protein
MSGYLIRTFLACLLLCASFAAAAETAKPTSAVRLFGSFAPEPGAWSEYAIVDKTTGKRRAMRLSIVGNTGDSYWLEVVNREGGGSDIVKMLVKGDPNDPENIQRLILKAGVNPAQEMDPDFGPMSRRMAGNMFEQRSGIPSAPAVDLQNVKTGEEVVTVAAGTFDVELHRIVDNGGRVYAEYKFSREVYPFGIVASEAGNTSMVLVGHGTGATSLITEEPIMMRQPPGMVPPQGMMPGSGSTIRQIPGMGTGYEPRQ